MSLSFTTVAGPVVDSPQPIVVPEFVAATPYWRGAREMVAWYDANPDRKIVDRDLDATLDRLAAEQ